MLDDIPDGQTVTIEIIKKIWASVYFHFSLLRDLVFEFEIRLMDENGDSRVKKWEKIGKREKRKNGEKARLIEFSSEYSLSLLHLVNCKSRGVGDVP